MGKIKMLIVEDDVGIQQLYDKGISEEKFEKKFSGNGIDALEIYKFWAPDIVILDIGLPKMDGYSVLKNIREEIEDVDTAVIIATSDSDMHRIRDCIMLGINDYIIKPFKYNKINDKIMNAYKWGKIPNGKK